MKSPTLKRRWLLAAAVLALGTMAMAQPRLAKGLLTDRAGMTLYVFDNDLTVPGKSACTGACLNMWTPLLAEPKAKPQGDFGHVVRDDGKVQWAYKGRPLYRWYADTRPGERGGDGLRGAWHVAKP